MMTQRELERATEEAKIRYQKMINDAYKAFLGKRADRLMGVENAEEESEITPLAIGR